MRPAIVDAVLLILGQRSQRRWPRAIVGAVGVAAGCGDGNSPFGAVAESALDKGAPVDFEDREETAGEKDKDADEQAKDKRKQRPLESAKESKQ